ncbi:MAG: alpha-amylase family glycosyl hydrolase [Lentisphaerota bacterium]
MKRQEPSWLKRAIFYQIYPQSFCDSNGDGIGDIQGIISRLDYIKETGFNAIWLNPIYVSPFKDAGYDVADFYKVAPRYGSNDDLKQLFHESKKRGIKVVLDIVAGHTSTEHQWFKESSKAEKNQYSNYYIWNDDWLDDADGLNMINGYAERNGNFAINFFSSQPALNYGFAKPDPKKRWQLPTDHPDVLAVGEELKKVMKFWLQAGCDGFRVDLAPSLIKKDTGHRAVTKFWQKFRQMFDEEYPEAVLISEWSYAPQALKAGFHTDFMVFCGTSAYTSLLRNEPERDLFSYIPKSLFYENDGYDYQLKNRNSFFDSRGLGDINQFMTTYIRHYQETVNKGYISLVSGNHDMTRMNDNRSDLDLELIFAFIATMPGVPFIYYGDEIGMRNVKGLTSVEGGYTRTQARTPMQWDATENAGFSNAPADKLYLPVDPDKSRPNIKNMLENSDSLLSKIKHLLKIRMEYNSLQADGKFYFVPVKKENSVLVYTRMHGKERLLMIFSPGSAPKEFCFKLDGCKPLAKITVANLEAADNNGEIKVKTCSSGYGIFKC